MGVCSASSKIHVEAISNCEKPRKEPARLGRFYTSGDLNLVGEIGSSTCGPIA